MKKKTRGITNKERATFLAMLIESSGVYDNEPDDFCFKHGWNGCSWQGMKMKSAFERIGTTELKILQKFICLNLESKEKLDEIICKKNIELELACKTPIAVE